MPHPHSERNFLAGQYRDSSKLAARQRIYQFATTPVLWHRWVFDHLSVPPAARLLELGCGNAALWRENLDRLPQAWDVTLSDLSEGMLHDAHRSLGDQARRRFRFARIDAQAIPFPDAIFDAVVANHMLYHVPDRPRAYAEVIRVVKTGGRLLAATNGDGHVLEIRQLIPASVPLRGGAGSAGFTLAAARDELAKAFTSVEVFHLRGELRVPDVEVIVQYLRSLDLPQTLSDAQLRSIRHTVVRTIQEQGFFRVTTETGLCRATI